MGLFVSVTSFQRIMLATIEFIEVDVNMGWWPSKKSGGGEENWSKKKCSCRTGSSVSASD